MIGPGAGEAQTASQQWVGATRPALLHPTGRCLWAGGSPLALTQQQPHSVAYGHESPQPPPVAVPRGGKPPLEAERAEPGRWAQKHSPPDSAHHAAQAQTVNPAQLGEREWVEPAFP